MFHLIIYFIIYITMKLVGMKIKVPKELYPSIGIRKNDDQAYIKYKIPYFYWIVRERGEIIVQEKFFHFTDLMYFIFKKITHEMASLYERKHRVKNQSFRRILFSHQIYLMDKLSHRWADKLKIDIDNILSVSPYLDEE